MPKNKCVTRLIPLIPTYTNLNISRDSKSSGFSSSSTSSGLCSSSSSTSTSEDGTMELGPCISHVIHQDNTLTNIIIRPTCLTACSCYEPNKSDNVDSIEAEENSINECIYYLNNHVSGSREWFTELGVMIAKLPNFHTQPFLIECSVWWRLWINCLIFISNIHPLTKLHWWVINLDAQAFRERCQKGWSRQKKNSSVVERVSLVSIVRQSLTFVVGYWISPSYTAEQCWIALHLKEVVYLRSW